MPGHLEAARPWSPAVRGDWAARRAAVPGRLACISQKPCTATFSALACVLIVAIAAIVGWFTAIGANELRLPLRCGVWKTYPISGSTTTIGLA